LRAERRLAAQRPFVRGLLKRPGEQQYDEQHVERGPIHQFLAQDYDSTRDAVVRSACVPESRVSENAPAGRIGVALDFV
jgi:hypothetical protein